MFGCNFAPTGWAQCNGQLLPISQNTALFSLLGTFYGGDGKSTFALPESRRARRRSARGKAPASATYFLGSPRAREFVTLLQSEMPAHAHILNAYPDDWRTSTSRARPWSSGATAASRRIARRQNTTMNTLAVGVSGGERPHNNMSPYLMVNFIIAMQGVFPPRS